MHLLGPGRQEEQLAVLWPSSQLQCMPSEWVTLVNLVGGIEDAETRSDRMARGRERGMEISMQATRPVLLCTLCNTACCATILLQRVGTLHDVVGPGAWEVRFCISHGTNLAGQRDCVIALTGPASLQQASCQICVVCFYNVCTRRPHEPSQRTRKGAGHSITY